ncbi:class II fructose-bisphosphate aldolase [candidate division KSB1 bacterium]|nr:class II fructose-bisphosphate aldolase [candidate division KSB1 bacterium]
MPLVLQREPVLEIYEEAANRKWVLPAFNAENLTTVEAILDAAREYGSRVHVKNLPVIISITNNYKSRPQSVYYTFTRQWQVGLKLFLADLHVLTSDESPFADLNVMIHLDHIQWDDDRELLDWNMDQFSSIMFDASALPLEQNIKKTAAFKEKHGKNILIEGACDEIYDSSSNMTNSLTTPDMAAKYISGTGVDIIVANLGTEHRSSGANLYYRRELARKITERTGPRLCLHGTSSVSVDKLTQLFDDGIRKVNIWTALERDSSALLFHNMLENASKIIGRDNAEKLVADQLLGRNVGLQNDSSVHYFTTTYRQGIIFQSMKENVLHYMKTFYGSF